MPGANGGAAETVACYQHHAADSGGCRSAARFGDAGDSKRGLFGLARTLFEQRNRGHVGIEQIEIGKCPRQQRSIGESGEFVIWCRTRHRDSALSQGIEAVRFDVVG